MTKSKYSEKNKVNDLNGKDWLLSTKSFWLSEKTSLDKDSFNHPAPFMIKDIEKLIKVFTKKGMSVLDPFGGGGTTALAANNLGRKSTLIDLKPDYRNLYLKRINKVPMVDDISEFIVGDSLKVLDKINKNFDYIVTSPPYHNILRNNSKGLRKKNTTGAYRTGSRTEVESYSDLPNDLGNQKTYQEFLILLEKIMAKSYKLLNMNKYCSIIISDFTVNKKEVNVQGNIVDLMTRIGFEFVGTIVLLQDNKPLYPFGYPYAFKINHMHQNIICFRKCTK
jgi:DNA modification methylase